MQLNLTRMGRGVFDIETPGVNLIESEILRKFDAMEFVRFVEIACRRLGGNSNGNGESNRGDPLQ